MDSYEQQDNTLAAVTRLVASMIAAHQGKSVVADSEGSPSPGGGFHPYRIDSVDVQWIGPLIHLDLTRRDTQQAIHVFVQVEIPPQAAETG